MGMHEKSPILGVGIDRMSLDAAVLESQAAIRRQRPPLTFACANPHSLSVAQDDAHFRSALNSTDIVVVDGIGLSVMARLARVPVGPRITGPDFFHTLMHTLEHSGGARVFFFGSTLQVLDRVSRRFKEEYPRLTLCGTLSPPFGTWSAEENAAMVSTINSAKPDVLWVGMTAPKQEKWVMDHRAGLNVPVIGSVGAVFDFFAGTQPRAPAWVRVLGLEWVFRLMSEPRRLWRRYLISSMKFVLLMLRHEVFRLRPSRDGAQT
jgi:N-acetylglucosaminyldiphosphoundecaprenol N-acetyl-beta-D-mannosaminyltransferase